LDVGRLSLHHALAQARAMRIE
jgi:hypothetical protein